MKSLKIFSIICILVLQSDYLMAQNKNDVPQNIDTSEIATAQTGKVSRRKPKKTDNQSHKTSGQNTIPDSVAMRTNKDNTTQRSNKDKKISVCIDTVMFRHQYEPIVEELNELRERNKVLQQDLQSKDERIAQLEKIDIDKFLNIRDSTIFDSNYLALSLDEIPVRSRDFYQLIKDIHELNNILNAIGNMPLTFDQFLRVGDQMAEAGLKIDAINSYATTVKLNITNYLSEEQKQFFRDLVTRYNDMSYKLDLINSRSIGSNDEE